MTRYSCPATPRNVIHSVLFTRMELFTNSSLQEKDLSSGLSGFIKLSVSNTCQSDAVYSLHSLIMLLSVLRVVLFEIDFYQIFLVFLR